MSRKQPLFRCVVVPHWQSEKFQDHSESTPWTKTTFPLTVTGTTWIVVPSLTLPSLSSDNVRKLKARIYINQRTLVQLGKFCDGERFRGRLSLVFYLRVGRRPPKLSSIEGWTINVIDVSDFPETWTCDHSLNILLSRQDIRRFEYCRLVSSERYVQGRTRFLDI